MKDISFGFIFDESLRHGKVVKRYLHYTKPDEPGNQIVTKAFILMWAIIQVNILSSTTLDFIESKTIDLLQKIFKIVNFHLASISTLLSTLTILGFGFFLVLIIYCFYISFTAGNLHLSFRRSMAVKIMKRLNGLSLLGLTNLIWVAYWFQTFSAKFNIGGDELNLFAALIAWTLFGLGIFFTGYTFFLFYWISPFFPSYDLKTFKQTYFSDLTRFVLVLTLVCFTELERFNSDVALGALFISLLGHFVIIHDLIRNRYLESNIQSFVLFVELILATFIFAFMLNNYGEQILKHKLNLGVLVIGVCTIFLIRLQSEASPYFKARALTQRHELLKKESLMEIFLDFNFKLKRPFFQKRSELNQHMTVADYPLDTLSTIIRHKQECNQLSCPCHEIDFRSIKDSLESDSASDKHQVNIFLSKSMENYILQNPLDFEILMWYMKFIFSYFKNYPFMFCQLKQISKDHLRDFQLLQIFSMEEETIYKWRYRNQDSIWADPISIGIFRYVDFVMIFNKVKTKACVLLRQYLALIQLLQNKNLEIGVIDKANKQYDNSKNDYIKLISKRRLESPLFLFNDELCRICIPELKRQNRFTQRSISDAQKTKIIDSENSSYLFVSMDNTSRGIIMNTNKNIERVVGFTANNLIGRLVNKMIPEDISIHHDGFLRKYISTGKGVFVDKLQELFLLHKNGFMIPVSIYVKNFLCSGDSSACMLAFFKKKEDKCDLVFVNPEGKILNMTERFERATKWKAILGLQDAFIQTLLPKTRSIFKSVVHDKGSEAIKTEIRKIAERDGICHGILYVTRLLANCSMPTNSQNELTSFSDLKAITVAKAKNDVRANILIGDQTDRPSGSSFKVRFEIETLPTDIGTFFIFAFSSISPHASRIENPRSSTLDIHRIVLLRLFVKSIMKSKYQKGLMAIMNDRRFERNLLRVESKSVSVPSLSSTKKKKKVEVKVLEELNVSKITEKRMFWFNVLVGFKVLVSLSAYLILMLSLYWVSLSTFDNMQKSFDITEKRNYIYNFISIIGLKEYHKNLPSEETFSKANNFTDYPFLPASRSYSETYLTQLLNSNVAFSEIQKRFFLTNLYETHPLSMKNNVTDQVINANNFLPLTPVDTLNITSNLYDMFVFFNFYMNKNAISHAKYSTLRINAYRLIEEYDLDYEHNQFLANIKSQINIITLVMFVAIGVMFVLMTAFTLMVVKFISDVAYFYSLTALISFSKNKIKAIKSLIWNHNLEFDLNSFNIKSLKSSSTRKRKFKLYRSLLMFLLMFMGGFFLISTGVLVAEVISLTAYVTNAVMATENVISNILNIDFIVAKVLVGLQDSSYPGRTAIPIFFSQFNAFFKGGFQNNNDFVSSINHASIDTDLCPLIAVPLNFTNCEQIQNGIFTKGYRQLASIVLHEITEASTNRLTFYKITDFETFGQVLMGFIYATQVMGDSFKQGVEKSVNKFMQVFLALTMVSFVILVACSALVHWKVTRVTRQTISTSLLLLLHIKPRIMLINSKLLRIFK